MPVHKGAKRLRVCVQHMLLGGKVQCMIKQGYCTILESSYMEGWAHGFLQDSSHRETVRIGGTIDRQYTIGDAGFILEDFAFGPTKAA